MSGKKRTLSEREETLEAFIFDLVSGVSPALQAEEVAAACALTLPKAQEICAVAEAWFDREMSL